MISVYIAARFETKDQAKKVRDRLAENGIGCTSRWLEEEPKDSEMKASEKCHVAEVDIHDVRRARALVLWNPDEKHKVGTGGCHVETGVAFGCGIPVFILGKPSNVFHFLPGVTWCDTVEDLIMDLTHGLEDFGPTWDSPEEQRRRR